MVATTLDAFALTLFKDSIALSPGERAEMAAYILQTSREAPALMPKKEGDTWTGDTKGHEFLFRNPLFSDLSRRIGQKIRDYVETLGIDGDQVDFYFQRSWATVSNRAERIRPHRHEQSNISFAYYLQKPQKSGSLQFIMPEVPNEFSPMAFGGEMLVGGFIKQLTLRNSKTVDVDAEEDEIIVFPSKTLHGTLPNNTDTPRISISGDVVLMLKDSTGHEYLMPHFSHWQQF